MANVTIVNSTAYVANVTIADNGPYNIAANGGRRTWNVSGQVSFLAAPVAGVANQPAHSAGWLYQPLRDITIALTLDPDGLHQFYFDPSGLIQ